jgi:hypothetical protein
VQALLVVVAIRIYGRNRELLEARTFGSTLAVISSVMLVLMVGNFLQIVIWAMVFMQLGEFTDFATATYHSAVNFATLGYGDIVMTEEHRILGPMQSLNGVLMVGVSTAVVMSALQDAVRQLRKTREAGNQ